jgi:hypothetical protein
MDSELLKWVATLGVGGVLAAMMFVFYRVDFLRERLFHRDASRKLTEVVEKNAETSATMARSMQELCSTIKVDVLARWREIQRGMRRREKEDDDA